jgi:hypothetical protein
VKPKDQEEAHRAGRLAGQAFAAALADAESRDRQERLTRLAVREIPVQQVEFVASAAVSTAAQRDFERLLHFHNSVTRSRSWIWLQRFRSLFGREW